jgi:putative transposase
VPSGPLGWTLPHDLHPLIRAPQRPLGTLLVNAARPTRVPCGHRNLGGQSGCPRGLPPWDQTLGAPVPLHCLMAAGALAANGARWIEAAPRCLLPGRAWSTVWRGKCCAARAQGGSTGAGPLVEGPLTLGTPEDCAPLRAALYTPAGVVSAQAPLAGPAHGLDYVGRATHRVAIANHRLLDVRDGGVRLASRNRRPGNRVQTMTRDADACIRRCLLPGFPRGVLRLRHSGFLAHRPQARTRRRCRALRGQPAEPPPRRPQSGVQWLHAVTGIDLPPWPHCGTPPLVRLPLSPLSPRAASRGTPAAVPIDASS